MTQVEQVKQFRIMLGDESVDNDVLITYLDLAKSEILMRAYPYDDSVTEVPKKYLHLQIQIALHLFNKRGAEGEKAHSENGISRTYAGSDISPSLLNKIVPQCGVLR